MLISERYSEYGITGAFFWVTQFLVIITLYGESPLTIWENCMSQINPFFSAIPDILKVSVAGVLGAFGIIGIFVAGLLMDLLGIFFSGHEMLIFRSQITRNKSWLQPFVEKHKDFFDADYENFLSHPEGFWWPKINRSFFIESLKNFWKINKLYYELREQYRYMHRYEELYNRLQSILISNVMLCSGSSKLEFFDDLVHLWRTGREISVAMIISALELALIDSIRFPGKNNLYILIYIIVSIVSVSILRLSYSRMCSTLFALSYIVEEQNKQNC